MTSRQRAQVVEVLRCIADDLVRGSVVYLDAYNLYGQHSETVSHAIGAWLSVPGFSFETALEAAARVEEGSWP